MKNIIIAASGTGGHMYPGIALARELEIKGYNPVFFVSDNEASLQIMANSGFENVKFNLSGMPRKFSFSFFVFLVKLAAAFFKALKNILILDPAAVVGMGGYISVPSVFAAKICRKKTFIHEQNTIPGEANRLLNRCADKTLISFRQSSLCFKNKNTIVYTGCPVRKEILNASKERSRGSLRLERDIFTLMIFGGSLGAVKLNENAFEAVKILAEKIKIQVIHITGRKSFEEIRLKSGGMENYRVFEYMHNIADAYAASDIVICRSGAGTVFELLLLGKPAILIPYPYAACNHQYHNAEEAAQNEQMILIEEKDVTPEKLAGLVELLKSGLKTEKENISIVYPQAVMAGEIIKNL